MERTTEFDVKLFNSSFDGDLEGVMAALAQGGSVAWRDCRGFTPLLTAAQNGHTDICGLLLTHGSDVSDRTHQGTTSMITAAQKGHTDICGLLLAHGSDVNEIDPVTKDTALHPPGCRA